MSSAQARFLVRLGEFERRQGFRDDGATSLESWTAERFGVSTPSARAYAHVAAKAWDIPHLVGSLCEGEISFDKVRALADVATPESDRLLCDQAKVHSVRELADIARSKAELARTPVFVFVAFAMVASCASTTPTAPSAPSCRADAYAETKAHIDAQLEQIPSEGATPLDQRRCDVLLGLLRCAVPGSTGSPTATTTASPYVVVAHVPLAALVEDAGEESALAGELEHGGLIDVETVQRIACDATVVVALDDDARAHHVRGPGPEVRHRYPAPRGEAPGPPVSLPGLHQHDLHQCPPRQTVETRGPHRPRQPRPHLLVPPPSGAQPGAGPCRATPTRSSPSPARAAGS